MRRTIITAMTAMVVELARVLGSTVWVACSTALAPSRANLHGRRCLYLIQVFHNGAGETSYLDYDQEELESGLTACFHEMSEPEFKGHWCRVWFGPEIHLLQPVAPGPQPLKHF
jgi:hypothetical protein